MMNDSDIRRNVEAELRWEPSVHDANAIGVAGEGRRDDAHGSLPSYAEVVAERAAERVSGVTARPFATRRKRRRRAPDNRRDDADGGGQSPSGHVMEILSEHTLKGWTEGHVLTTSRSPVVL